MQEGKDVSSCDSSGATDFSDLAAECVGWLPGHIGPALVVDSDTMTLGDAVLRDCQSSDGVKCNDEYGAAATVVGALRVVEEESHHDQDESRRSL